MKLYRVQLRGMTSKATRVAYGDSYVVAGSPSKAYEIVREYLDKRDLGFTHERALCSVELLAEGLVDYPECRTQLHIQE